MTPRASEKQTPGEGEDAGRRTTRCSSPPVAPGDLKAWLAECDPSPHLLSVGRSIDVYKDMGHPAEIAERYRLWPNWRARTASGHTRMATESAVSPARPSLHGRARIFAWCTTARCRIRTACAASWRKKGIRFETDNDTEAACRFIEWRLQQGQQLDVALETAFTELDGFYTLLIATESQLTLVRDAFACKPAVVAETDDYVAISSEFRSLAHLPGVAEANIFEPLPEEIYSWKV